MLNSLLAILILAQTAQAPAFRVSGSVSREDGQTPQGQVRLLSPNGTAFTAQLAADGTFQFPRVPGGTYQFGGGPAVATVAMEPRMIAIDKDLTDLRLIVPRVSTVGVPRVLTTVEGGGPRPRYQVTYSKVGAPAGTIPFSVTAGGGPVTVNMNAGDYRVATLGLPAGFIVKSITTSTANLLEHPLKLGVGETPTLTVLLGVSSPPPWVKVSGRVTGLRATEVALLSPGGTADSQYVQTKPDGSFEFATVLPGIYSLEANTPMGSTSRPVTVDFGKDLTDIEIKTPLARNVPGRVIINDSAKPRVGFGILAPNRPINAASPRAQFTAPTTADGRFTLLLPEGENRLVFDASLVPPGFTLKSATYGSLDILANPIKVALTDTAELTLTFDSAGVAPVSVSGRINGFNGTNNATKPSIFLISIATNAALETTVGPDGSFAFPRVFPGQYQTRFSFNSVQIETGVNVGTANKTDVVLNYTRQFMLTGQVVMEGFPVGTSPLPVTVEVRRTSGAGSPLSSRTTSVGVFRIMAPEGELRFTVRDVPAGYQVKSFSYGDLDLMKNPLNLDDPAVWTFVLKIVRQ